MATGYWHRTILVATAGAVLAAAVLPAEAGYTRRKRSYKPPTTTTTTTTTTTAPAPANTAPVISGTPATSVVAGSAYAFLPRATDAEGNPLGFSISNKPSWAAFSTATGALTGTATPLQVGTYPNIVIAVSDGTTTQSLPVFGIAVTPPATPAANGTATLSWTAPGQNTDGSLLTDLAGYKVYHGTSASVLNEVIDVPGAVSTTYTYNQLATGTHYFAVAAYNNAGLQGSLSAVGSKTLP